MRSSELIVLLFGVAVIGHGVAYPSHRMPVNFLPFKKNKKVTTTTESPNCVNRCELFKDYCQNGGECIHDSCTNFRCKCRPGFTGTICETRESDVSSFAQERLAQQKVKTTNAHRHKHTEKVTTTPKVTTTTVQKPKSTEKISSTETVTLTPTQGQNPSTEKQSTTQTVTTTLAQEQPINKSQTVTTTPANGQTTEKITTTQTVTTVSTKGKQSTEKNPITTLSTG